MSKYFPYEYQCRKCGTSVEAIDPKLHDTPCLNVCGGALMLIREPRPSSDQIYSPAHYTYGGIEVLDYIEAKELNFRLGNCIKYLSRADHKGDALGDLRKAAFYLQREIAFREARRKRLGSVIENERNMATTAATGLIP